MSEITPKLTARQKEKLRKLRNHVDDLQNIDYQKEKERLENEIKKHKQRKDGMKTRVLSLKVSDKEHLEILERVKGLRMNTSEYLRSLVKSDLRRRK